MMVVWEYALRGPGRLEQAELLRRCPFALGSASEEQVTGYFALTNVRPGIAA